MYFSKIKNLINMLLVLLLSLALFNCQKVPAGNVGVKVYLLGGDKGVDHEELGVGRYWIGINEELYLFPTFTQNYVWTADNQEGSPNDESITFQTTEGLTVNGDIGISYHINPSKVSIVFQKYRRGVGEITDTFLRNMVRDAFAGYASKLSVESVYGKGKNSLLDSVQASVIRQVEPIGIEVEKIYYIGSLRLPETVVNALNSKIEATQRAEQRENELREAEAQAKKLIVSAQAEAEAIRVKRLQIDEKLIQYEAVQKWNGVLPGTMLGSNGVPFINVK